MALIDLGASGKNSTDLETLKRQAAKAFAQSGKFGSSKKSAEEVVEAVFQGKKNLSERDIMLGFKKLRANPNRKLLSNQIDAAEEIFLATEEDVEEQKKKQLKAREEKIAAMEREQEEEIEQSEKE